MASLTIRNLDDDLKERLRVRAAQHGHSMEEEARAILRSAVGGATGAELWRQSRKLFSGSKGVDFAPPRRDRDRAVPGFTDQDDR
jgi:plasmid stability protein